jgi:hypothetical protein
MARSTAAASRALSVLLPPQLAARLAVHCAAWDESEADAIADAIAFYLDDAECGQRPTFTRVPLMGTIT